MQLPRFYTDKKLNTRGISKIKLINTSYDKLRSIFGIPTTSEAAGDTFDGFETVSWKIKFESGHIAEITDTRKFGVSGNAKSCSQWAIYGHSNAVASYIEQYLSSK